MKKKLIFLALFGLAFQYWDHIDNFVFAQPDYSSAQNQVTLYATEWCGYCEKTRRLLKANNISYVEYDIEKSEWARREHKRLGGRGVPLIKINGKVIHGYNEKAILASLKSS